MGEVIDQKTRVMLGKLLGMLGSDHDGEIISAAKMMRKVLSDRGLSFPDVVQLIVEPPATIQMEDVRDNPPRADEAPKDIVRVVHTMSTEMLNKHWDRMQAHERNFVLDMNRWSRLGKLRLSEKQESWFKYLYKKYCAA